ncbi:MAG: DUF6498-containing protein [Gammaproteobacteria bacterium]
MIKSGMSPNAPRWLMQAMIPLLARNIAREMVKRHPDKGADEIIAIMRQQASSSDPRAEQLFQAVRRYLPDRPDVHAAIHETRRAGWLSPSSVVLVAANLIPVYGVFVLGWPVFPILLLYWLENVAIGVLNVLRMLLADPGDPVLWGGKLFLVPFFCFHYGFFTAIHGSFVVGLFGGKVYRKLDHGLLPIEGVVRAITDYNLGWAVLILAASHLFSLFWNYLGRGEFRRASPMILMQRPYSRVVIMHLTILLGGGGAMVLGSPLWALLLLIALKIGFDLRAHIKEHRRALA